MLNFKNDLTRKEKELIIKVLKEFSEKVVIAHSGLNNGWIDLLIKELKE